MAEKLASSRIDRILGLIDDALDDGPCWRCQTRSGTQQSGLCDQCRDELRAEKAPRLAGLPETVWSTPPAVWEIPPGVYAITVDLQTYGAVGDGVTDDTAAFDRAIAAVNAASARFDGWAADLAEVFAEVGDEIAHVAGLPGLNGVLVGPARPDEPAEDSPVAGRPKRKPPRTCPRHGVVMAGGLCRRCAR